MGFTRKSDKGAWSRWLLSRREKLIETGVPDDILKSQLRWISLLEEGADHQLGWDVSMLSGAQAKVLKELVEREFESPAHIGTLRYLSEVIERAET